MACEVGNGKYVVSVADALLFDTSCGGEQLILNSKTLINSSITQAIQAATIYGGKGSGTLYEYNYQKELTVTIEDAVFSPVYLAVQNGTNIVNELANVYTQEKVTFDDSGKATLTGTPAGNVQVATGNGVFTTVKADEKVITVLAAAGTTADVVYYESTNQNKIKIGSNSFPKMMKLVLNIDIFDANGLSQKMQITIDNFKPDGALDLSLTHDGVATSSMAGKAFVNCDGNYAEITFVEVAQSTAPCYTALVATPNVVELDLVGGTETISVVGMRGGIYGNVTLDNTSLTWESTAPEKVAVSNAGVITVGATAATADIATVKATDGSGLTATISVTID